MCLAGAGAGKTHALVERMVACIGEGKVDIAHMAAITFTR
jgi:superfamily I DNA/RNA helicase